MWAVSRRGGFIFAPEEGGGEAFFAASGLAGTRVEREGELGDRAQIYLTFREITPRAQVDFLKKKIRIMYAESKSVHSA